MMTGIVRTTIFFLTIIPTLLTGTAQPPPVLSPSATARTGYIGFDRNDYPGDSSLKILRQIFSYTGYWLNNPPGAKANSWRGKRRRLQEAGFGFLVLFDGRTYAQIKANGDAARLGASDAAAAISAAHADGFPPNTVIFLDQEQGGRLLPDQRAYLHGWVDAVNSANFAAGVYCSGIAAKEAADVSVITAQDIRQNAGNRKIKYWVVNDTCPPSPGCSVTTKNLLPESSGISFSDVWQYAQSPKRPDFARSCPANYNKDGNCYPPGVSATERLHVDLNVSTSRDPSHGRTPE
jgi:Rv2525c-like, glycoside hydrolase-like domain